jgi:hypothetical protein
MKATRIVRAAGVLVAVLLVPGLCMAQTSETLKVPSREKMQLKMNPSIARMALTDISGRVKLANPSNGHPTVANACAYITVTASEKTSISVPTGKAGESLKLDDFKPVRAVKASGNFKKTGYCQYFMAALPLNKNLYVNAKYSGGWSEPLGGGPIVSRPTGWTNPITLTSQHKNRANANLEILGIPLR